MTFYWTFVCILILFAAIVSWRQFFDLIQGNSDFKSAHFLRPKTSSKKEVIHVWHTEQNCGLQRKCSADSFPIYLSTGIFPNNKAKLCIGGKYLLKPDNSGEGRGLNAAIVESKNFEVVSIKNFDTYLFNKTAEIAEWINGIFDDDIVIIFTYDEASTRLGEETKTLFYELGSGKIQNLQFRSQWYMITQKGSKGFTTYEKITYSKKNSWGDKIEFRGCIPRKIPKKITTADEPLKENKRKIKFCDGKKGNNYKGFCNEARFEIIMPALLTNKSLVGNLAYTLPIFLYASSDLEIFISAVDSLIHQPGINTALITILYESQATDVPNIAKIYGLKSKKIKFQKTIEEKLIQARKLSNKVFPQKKYLIVIDSQVIPSPDFLFFIAQIVPIVEKDIEVSIISGWSPNCYKQEGSVHLVYRIQGTPKYAALIPSAGKNTFYDEIFAPDVPRVQGPETCHLPSLEPGNWIERPQDLLKSRYFHKLVMLQQLSQVIEVDEILNSCLQCSIKNETNAIYLRSDNETVSKVVSCLGVINNQYGKYDGIVRLHIHGKTFLIITSESSFYKSRPIVTI